MTALVRRHDWPEAMAAFIDAHRPMPFEWGSNDCALFPADGWKVMTGVDLAADFRGRYDTERGARRIAREAGGMRELVLRAGLMEKPKDFAQRYDVVLVPTEGWETLGLNIGNGYWCAPGPDGLVFRPIVEIAAAFGL
jgi:hypothetical protein